MKTLRINRSETLARIQRTEQLLIDETHPDEREALGRAVARDRILIENFDRYRSLERDAG